MATATKAPKPKPTGIQAGHILPTEEFCARMGWGRKAFVAARHRGLPVHKKSRRLYVVTDEAISWFKSQAAVTA
jgi:hypothetical protein